MLDLLGYFLFVFAGLFFGLFGSGGSIIIIPVLVYIFQIPIYEATTYSLLIVFLVSVSGTLKHFRDQNFHIKKIIYFAVPALLFTCLSRVFLFPAIPNNIVLLNMSKHTLLMLLFAIVILGCSLSLLRKPNIIHNYNLKTILIFVGILVGVLSGLLGIGGGFIIVPTLILFADMNIKESASSALFLISINTFVAIILEITIFQFQFDFIFIASLLLSGLTGLLLGIKLLNQIDLNLVKKMFSFSLLLLSLIIFFIELI
tara:strand:+ start:100 stop:873 length:774 start_codon:yes stop_codon:yes gene_type:complete